MGFIDVIKQRAKDNKKVIVLPETEEPSYDVMVEDGEPCLYKHIPESYILSNVS